MLILLYPIRGTLSLLREMLRIYENLLAIGGWRALIAALSGAVVCWFIYTPIHEMLHVLACWATGGTVRELELQTIYGGAIFAEIFPFVTAGGQYAGRLSDFTVPNDAAYFVVDLAPYSLSLIGMAWIRYAASHRSGFHFGAALVVALVPLWSIPGDFFEAISLVTSHLAESMNDTLPRRVLVADDVGRLWTELADADKATPILATLIGLTLIIAAYAALFCVAIQDRFARYFFNLEPSSEFLKGPKGTEEQADTANE